MRRIVFTTYKKINNIDILAANKFHCHVWPPQSPALWRPSLCEKQYSSVETVWRVVHKGLSARLQAGTSSHRWVAGEGHPRICNPRPHAVVIKYARHGLPVLPRAATVSADNLSNPWLVLTYLVWRSYGATIQTTPSANEADGSGPLREQIYERRINFPRPTSRTFTSFGDNIPIPSIVYDRQPRGALVNLHF